MNGSVVLNADYEVRNHREPSQPERRLAAAVIHRAALDMFLCREGSEKWKLATRFFTSLDSHNGTFEWYAEACRINSGSVRAFLFDDTKSSQEKYKILIRAYSKVSHYLRDKE